MKTKIFLLFLLYVSVSFSQNPICPPGLFVPNPTARVWDDGMLYVYGSRDDENTKIWSSKDYGVMRTKDLVNWDFIPNIFKSSSVPYNTESNLFAPGIGYKDGVYYLYYCQSARHREGVATSTSPLGPFGNAKKLNLVKRYNQIDPTIFIDDDGQAYYSWGQFKAKVAKMKSMTEVDLTTVKDSVLTHAADGFIEGNFMTKRKDIYYMVYAVHPKGEGPALAYSTSKNPLGPYTYGGILISNGGCDPTVRNNHGSIVEFKGKWYVFYHRARNGIRMRRQTCIEPITFLEDGTIPEVEMTSQGALGKPLSAFETIRAERACKFGGHVRTASFQMDLKNLTSPDNNDGIDKIIDKDWAEFKYVDFGKKGAKQVKLKVRPVQEPYKIHIVIDNPDGKIVGTVEVPGGGNGEDWMTVKGNVSVKNVHALYLTFTTNATKKTKALLAIDELIFK